MSKSRPEVVADGRLFVVGGDDHADEPEVRGRGFAVFDVCLLVHLSAPAACKAVSSPYTRSMWSRCASQEGAFVAPA